MSRYNLDTFSPQDFQKFCISVILAKRPGAVHPFTHKGPDGGVDAYSYDGGDVYQIKHHEIGYVGTQAANKLTIRDFTNEIRSLFERNKLSPRTFTLITNVRLYPATVSKIQELAKAVVPKLSTIIWDAGILEAELDNNVSLRTAWFEQVGDIAERLSQEIERLQAVAAEVSTAEVNFNRFLANLPGQRSAEPSMIEVKAIGEKSSGDAEERLRIARLLRGKRGNAVLKFLLEYFMVDYSLLATFEKIDLPLLKDCLKETVQSIVECRTPGAALFLTGCLIRPFAHTESATAVDLVCLQGGLQELPLIDSPWLACEFISLYGKSRAVWLWEFLSHHICKTSPNQKPLTVQFHRALQRQQTNSVAVPSAQTVYEEIVYGEWIGDEYIVIPSKLRTQARKTFKHHYECLAYLKDPEQRVHIAVALTIEETIGITPYDCDFAEGSKYDALIRFYREKLLAREIVVELKEVLGISEEEFQHRDQFSWATEKFIVTMLAEGLTVLDIPFDRYSRSSINHSGL